MNRNDEHYMAEFIGITIQMRSIMQNIKMNNYELDELKK